MDFCKHKAGEQMKGLTSVLQLGGTVSDFLFFKSVFMLLVNSYQGYISILSEIYKKTLINHCIFKRVYFSFYV